VQYSAIDHYSAIIEISHKACGLEVKNLERAIFTSCKKPLVVLLEPKSSDVTSVAFIGYFVLMREYVVHLNHIMSGHSEVFSVGSNR
jgi:hypothetical protein